MSIRYGVELVFEPKFTARLYRARQLVCGQYGCWAAEMHMLRMPLVSYFECPEASLASLDAGLARVAAKRRGTLVSVAPGNITADVETGSIALNFTHNIGGLLALREEVAAAAARTPGARLSVETFRPRISLLEFGGLPPAILDDATEYARVVVGDLALPVVTQPWRLVVLRYSSEAAGDDWSNGRWAADVSWRQLFSYAL